MKTFEINKHSISTEFTKMPPQIIRFSCNHGGRKYVRMLEYKPYKLSQLREECKLILQAIERFST